MYGLWNILRFCYQLQQQQPPPPSRLPRPPRRRSSRSTSTAVLPSKTKNVHPKDEQRKRQHIDIRRSILLSLKNLSR